MDIMFYGLWFMEEFYKILNDKLPEDASKKEKRLKI